MAIEKAKYTVVEKIDDFTYSVRSEGKEVTFHLHQLTQAPPSLFELGEDEKIYLLQGQTGLAGSLLDGLFGGHFFVRGLLGF